MVKLFENNNLNFLLRQTFQVLMTNLFLQNAVQSCSDHEAERNKRNFMKTMLNLQVRQEILQEVSAETSKDLLTSDPAMINVRTIRIT